MLKPAALTGASSAASSGLNCDWAAIAVTSTYAASRESPGAPSRAAVNVDALDSVPAPGRYPLDDAVTVLPERSTDMPVYPLPDGPPSALAMREARAASAACTTNRSAAEDDRTSLTERLTVLPRRAGTRSTSPTFAALVGIVPGWKLDRSALTPTTVPPGRAPNAETTSRAGREGWLPRWAR